MSICVTISLFLMHGLELWYICFIVSDLLIIYFQFTNIFYFIGYCSKFSFIIVFCSLCFCSNILLCIFYFLYYHSYDSYPLTLLTLYGNQYNYYQRQRYKPNIVFVSFFVILRYILWFFCMFLVIPLLFKLPLKSSFPPISCQKVLKC